MSQLETSPVILGVDLAGSPKRPTGICVLEACKAKLLTVFSDEEILKLVTQHQPEVVPIDAPLSIPPGRASLSDNNGVHLRPCDKELQQMGIRFFPITIGPMRMLTERGLELKEEIEKLGLRAIECFPGASQDVWGLPRKQHDLEGLRRGLRRMGLLGITKKANDHELDAASAAFTGRLYLEGKGVMLGGEDGILVPASE